MTFNGLLFHKASYSHLCIEMYINFYLLVVFYFLIFTQSTPLKLSGGFRKEIRRAQQSACYCRVHGWMQSDGRCKSIGWWIWGWMLDEEERMTCATAHQPEALTISLGVSPTTSPLFVFCCIASSASRTPLAFPLTCLQARSLASVIYCLVFSRSSHHSILCFFFVHISRDRYNESCLLQSRSRASS